MHKACSDTCSDCTCAIRQHSTLLTQVPFVFATCKPHAEHSSAYMGAPGDFSGLLEAAAWYVVVRWSHTAEIVQKCTRMADALTAGIPASGMLMASDGKSCHNFSTPIRANQRILTVLSNFSKMR